MELKSCPFCGGEYTQVRYIGGEWQEPSAFESGYRGECCSCDAITAAYNTESEAASAWNTRHVETCKVEGSYYSELMDVYVFSLSCGDSILWNDEEPPNYCPDCGRKVEG